MGIIFSLSMEVRQLNQQISFLKENATTKLTNFLFRNRIGIEKSPSCSTPMNVYLSLVARKEEKFWQLLVNLAQISCTILRYCNERTRATSSHSRSTFQQLVIQNSKFAQKWFISLFLGEVSLVAADSVIIFCVCTRISMHFTNLEIRM